MFWRFNIEGFNSSPGGAFTAPAELVVALLTTPLVLTPAHKLFGGMMIALPAVLLGGGMVAILAADVLGGMTVATPAALLVGMAVALQAAEWLGGLAYTFSAER